MAITPGVPNYNHPPYHYTYNLSDGENGQICYAATIRFIPIEVLLLASINLPGRISLKMSDSKLKC